MNDGPAKRPVGTAAAATVGIVAALITIALGVVGVRDALHALGAVGGPSWTGWLAGQLETVRPAAWMIPAGIIAVVVGLLFLIAALKPRRVTHTAVGQDGVWIRRRDIARLATESAEGVDSVISATAKSRRRTVRITARASGDTDRVATELATAVGERLAVLSPPPRIRSRIVEER
ncbi:MAG TPA: DUF6286 domain-containing protein [Kribbella sp.]|jgi:hypothetical protein